MEEAAPRRGLARCRLCFWLAVTFDVVGLALLLVGVFVDVFYSDVLIYTGGVGIFFSLLWWVFWYVGNIEVPQDELQDDVGLDGRGKAARGRQGLARLVRSLSVRFPGTFASFPGAASTVVATRKTTTTTTTSSSNPATGGGVPKTASTQALPPPT